MRFTFTQSPTDEDFRALNACRSALLQSGFSHAPWRRGKPCGATFGRNYLLSEPDWSNLHATITGNGRDGPIVLTIHENCPPEGRVALEAAARAKTEEVNA